MSWRYSPSDVAGLWKAAGLTLADARKAWDTTPLARITFHGKNGLVYELSPAVQVRKSHKLVPTRDLAIPANDRAKLEGEVYIRVGEKAHRKPATFPALACACYEDHPYMLMPDFYSADLPRMQKLRDQLSDLPLWEERKPMAVARFGSVGHVVGDQRIALCKESGPLLDAKIARPLKGKTKLGATVPEDCWGKWMSPAEQAHYRYLVNVDSWEGRFWKLYSGSLLIELETPDLPWVTWRSQYMSDGTDYLSVDSPVALDELLASIDYAPRVKGIALNGRKIALRMDDEFTIDYATKTYQAYLETFS